ncbi:MAG TPA: polyphosphate kinase 2 family protein [Gammaproteobacteria bacterium]|nr:polyphosphate kinase 2 family protein [Gammaproteobacteria bacterium]
MARPVPKHLSRLLDPYCITKGSKFRLKDVDPADTGRLHSESKSEAKRLLAEGVRWLAEEQERLYAQDRWGVLLIFQAMDAAGKDSTIKHVMSGVNPQGVQVHSFKQPSAEELDHDFLWRCARLLPERGRIGIFNRSYYEEVLVVRVPRELLARQKIPDGLVGKRIWRERFEDIRAFESYLAGNGYLILKFFLHISRHEQKQRFLERLDTPDKHWKFSAADVGERRHWDDYQSAYEDMIRNTAARHAPWYVVPADNKWYTRMVVAAAIVDAMDRLNLQYPRTDAARRKTLAAARRSLLAE